MLTETWLQFHLHIFRSSPSMPRVVGLRECRILNTPGLALSWEPRSIIGSRLMARKDRER